MIGTCSWAVPGRDWDLGFVGLAATAIANFQKFWKVFQPSRKSRLRYYKLSGERELLGDGRGSKGESQAGGDPGAGFWTPGGPGRPPSLGKRRLAGDEIPFWCLKSCHVEKSRYSRRGL